MQSGTSVCSNQRQHHIANERGQATLPRSCGERLCQQLVSQARTRHQHGNHAAGCEVVAGLGGQALHAQWQLRRGARSKASSSASVSVSKRPGRCPASIRATDGAQPLHLPWADTAARRCHRVGRRKAVAAFPHLKHVFRQAGTRLTALMVRWEAMEAAKADASVAEVVRASLVGLCTKV